MTAQVMFLNTLYAPSEKEKKKLEKYQLDLEEYHAELAFISREWDRYQQVIYREQSHRAVRDSWKLLRLDCHRETGEAGAE